MHILVLISVFITVKSMDYAYEDSDGWTDFDQEKESIGSSFGWRNRNDTVLPYHGPENEKGQRSLQRIVLKALKSLLTATERAGSRLPKSSKMLITAKMST